MLTDKAKQEFLEYYWNNKIKPLKISNCKRVDLEDFFYSFSDLFQNALIIDWFDSVGISINVTCEANNSADSCEGVCQNCNDCYDIWNTKYEFIILQFSEIENNQNDYVSYWEDISFESRKEATKKAIEKANEIFNI